MNTKIRLLNASASPDLLAMREESYLRVLTDGDPITLSDIKNFTEQTTIGHSIEIKFGTAYTIPLETDVSEVLLELKKLQWGLMLIVNGKAKIVYVSGEATENQFNAIKDYPELRVVDFGSGKNEHLKNLTIFSDLKELKEININDCPNLSDISDFQKLSNLETLWIKRFTVDKQFQHISSLSNLKKLSQSSSELKKISHLDGLKNLQLFSAARNKNLTDLTPLSGLLNLTNLDLNSCVNLTDLTPINGLLNLTNLNLSLCQNLTDLTPLSGLVNLTNLKCKCLTDLTPLSGLLNLTYLNLNSCSNLTDLTPLSGLKNLTTLNLKYCIDLTDLTPLGGLKNLTNLNLERCENLTDLTPLSGLINLTNLNLERCENLTDLTPLSGLTNLINLILSVCENLTDLTPLSGLMNLMKLNLVTCTSLTDLTSISGLLNLTNLNLGYCKNISDLTPLSGLLNLTNLNLNSCENLTSIRMLKKYEKLSEVDLSYCGAVRDFEELINCPQLKKLKWTEKAACCYVVMGSASRRNDTEFIEEKISEWIEAIKLTKNPESYAKELIASVQLISDQNEVAEMLSASATELRKRGLADGDKDNALSAFIWELWAEAALQTGSENFKSCYEMALLDLNAERETEVLLSPLLTTMADIPAQYPEAKEWALILAEQTLAPIAELEHTARLAAPAAAVFYAGMQLPEKVQYWLEKGTHPQIPRWLDNILLALVRYYSHKEDFSSSRNYLNKIKLPDLLDEGRSLLAASMAKSSPAEAVEEMALIIDLAVQTALAKQLMKEPVIITDTNGLYQLLLCLEHEPETLAEFLKAVLTQNPDSVLVKSIASWFAEENKNVSNATALLHLCTNPALSDFVAPRMLERFKQELQTEADQEREPLSKDLAKRFIEKGLLTEADESEFIKTFHKQ